MSSWFSAYLGTGTTLFIFTYFILFYFYNFTYEMRQANLYSKGFFILAFISTYFNYLQYFRGQIKLNKNSVQRLSPK